MSDLKKAQIKVAKNLALIEDAGFDTGFIDNHVYRGANASFGTPTGIDDFIFNDTGSGRTLEGGNGRDILIGGAGGDTFIGGFGIDTVAYTASLDGVIVSLDPTFASLQVNDAQGDTFDSIENLVGSLHADDLIGNGGPNELYGAAGNDRLFGQGGHDTLDGGRGADTLVGGAGADKFAFHDIADVGLDLLHPDLIGDFTRSDGDKIDLHRIDARLGTGTDNDQFTFVNGPSTAAGTVWITGTGPEQIVHLNVDGGAEDARIIVQLIDITSLAAGDFIL